MRRLCACVCVGVCVCGCVCKGGGGREGAYVREAAWVVETEKTECK